MFEYRSNLTLSAASAQIHAAQRIVVTTHAKPDGDAFGSVAALTQALRLLGKQATGVLVAPVPAMFGALRGDAVVKQFTPDTGLPEADLLIILDTGAWAQVAPLRPIIEKRLDHTLIVDHHLTGDIPAPFRYLDTSSGSCAEVVAELIDELAGVSRSAVPPAANPLIDAIVAESLYVGVVADTGWFRYSNTRPATHDLAARLLRLGVNHVNVYATLEQTQRPEKLALMQRGLGSLRLLEKNRAALIVLRAEDFSQTGATSEETEGLVDLPRNVAGIEVVVVISQAPGGTAHEPVRISFRSKAGPGALDVAKFAGRFGGGGHARAAGAKIANEPIDAVVERVVAALPELFAG